MSFDTPVVNDKTNRFFLPLISIFFLLIASVVNDYKCIVVPTNSVHYL